MRYTTFRKLIQSLNKKLSFAGMFLLIPMMLLTTADVAGRSLFNRPVTGAYELSSYMLAIFVLLGIAYTYQVKGHVRVTMLLKYLPERASAAVDLLTTLLCMFIISVLAWQGWVVGAAETAVSEQLRIPELPFRLLVPLAAACVWLELLLDLVDHAGKLAGRSA